MNLTQLSSAVSLYIFFSFFFHPWLLFFFLDGDIADTRSCMQKNLAHRELFGDERGKEVEIGKWDHLEHM